MTSPAPTLAVTSAVEGDLDSAVVGRILIEAGAVAGPVHGLRGRPAVLAGLDGYNRAARFAPWVVLVDLDSDDCAPKLASEVLPAPAPYMRFRIAVREIESWLLADRERIARFLGVPQGRIPLSPDDLLDPKEELVSLARGSTKKGIRLDLVPRPGSGRSTGPLYNPRLIEFVQDAIGGWRPTAAALVSPSLRRAVTAVEALVES